MATNVGFVGIGQQPPAADQGMKRTFSAWLKDKFSPRVDMGRQKVGREGIRWMKWLMFFGVVALVAYSVPLRENAQHKPESQFLSILSVGFMVSGAALLFGGILGFLFGIPHTISAAGGTEHAGERIAVGRSYEPNTDLEQIADWLTKILVGVGLTELTRVPGWLRSLGSQLEPWLGGNGVFAVSLGMYFALCGFLIGFLWTRVFFQQALRWADDEMDNRTAINQLLQRADQQQEKTDSALEVAKGAQRACDEATKGAKDNQDAEIEAWDLVSRQLNLKSGLAETSAEELRAKIEKATPLAQERIFQHASLIRSANWSSNRELMLRTIPIFQALTDITPNKSEYHGELGFALKDKGDSLKGEKANQSYEAAKTQLDLAIRNRPQDAAGAAWYEYLRALCLIHLDEDFKADRPSQEESLRQIMADLTKAKDSNMSDVMAREGEPLGKWITLNKVGDKFPLREEVHA